MISLGDVSESRTTNTFVSGGEIDAFGHEGTRGTSLLAFIDIDTLLATLEFTISLFASAIIGSHGVDAIRDRIGTCVEGFILAFIVI